LLAKLAAVKKTNAWLGASDEEKAGEWKWVNGQPWKYTHWAKGRPDNPAGTQHHLCIWVAPMNGIPAPKDGIRWWNQDAGARMGFICQWEEKPPPPSPVSVPWSFKSAEGKRAKSRYLAALETNRKQFAAELDEAVKEASQDGKLEQALKIRAALTNIRRPVPENLVKIGEKFYCVVEEKATWHRAKEICETMGGRLACVENASLDAALFKLVQPYLAKGENVWLGGSDEVKEGEWQWVDGHPMKYSNWMPNEPNNGGGVEHHLLYWTTNAGKWGDFLAGLRTVFICEWGQDAVQASVPPAQPAPSVHQVLPLEQAASASTTKLWDNRRYDFPEWGDMKFFDIPFVVPDPKNGTVKNVIELHCQKTADTRKLPKEVTLPCNVAAKKLHLLGGVTGWGWGFVKGAKPTTSMIVRLHYENGEVEERNLVSGTDLTDWGLGPDVPGSQRIEWKGPHIRYLTITPKHTDQVIKSIQFVKGPDDTCPAVFAVTVEKVVPE
jgi:hypothetical protein